MADNSPSTTPQAPPVTPVEFRTVAAPAPCSWLECTGGHRWAPQAVVAACPACATPVAAVQKTQCPYCNEPVQKGKLRVDFVPRGGGVTARCKGNVPSGETFDMEFECVQWQEVTATPQPTFEERRTRERGTA